MTQIHSRPKTYAFCGGAFGDEGKGRIVDMVVADLRQKGEVVVYRDNGGANAGHTIEFANGQRVAFHQLPSGVFVKGAYIVLGKEMVIHPGDLVEELKQISAITFQKDRATILIDALATLSLDTHRAYEGVLKQWQEGGKGSTGRGISPAYADVLLRHPLRLRDVVNWNEAKITQHYEMYNALIKGLGQDLSKTQVATLSGTQIPVGTYSQFKKRLEHQTQELKPYIKDLQPWLTQKWEDKTCGFVFEKAQAIGLDYRWGVYPDVTASDTTFDGIFSATQGVIDPDLIQIKAAVIKATYMSSVGTRQLPTLMESKLAERIRQQAHEYGATTKRPRDIAYLDIPALRYFCRVGRANCLVLTHMDIVYSDQPVHICTEYRIGKKPVEYQPDQEFLHAVQPVYTDCKPWSAQAIAKAKTFDQLPREAKQFLKFVARQIGLPVFLITTGPKRDQVVMCAKI